MPDENIEQKYKEVPLEDDNLPKIEPELDEKKKQMSLDSGTAADNSHKSALHKQEPNTGSIEPENLKPDVSEVEKFSIPKSYEDRFYITKDKNRQDFYRSYKDKRPAIIDLGDKLNTKNADRGTAMDMVEVAVYRGWSSMKINGPNDFKREMWIEGTAHGLDVKGYRPTELDRSEAERREAMIATRSIERLDQPAKQNEKKGVNQRASDKPSNVVEMPNYYKGVTGKILDIGAAPYQNRDGAEKVPFIEIQLSNGQNHKIWGVGLPEIVEKHGLKSGDQTTIYSPGRKAVTLQKFNEKTGAPKNVQSYRREWDAKDIERSKSNPSHEAITSIPKTERTIEDLKKPNAIDNPELKGVLSAIAKIDAEMRAVGVSDKDRQTVKENVRDEMNERMSKGQKYNIQKLPNVTKSQKKLAIAKQQSIEERHVNEKASER